jgi:hypothetical protein
MKRNQLILFMILMMCCSLSLIVGYIAYESSQEEKSDSDGDGDGDTQSGTPSASNGGTTPSASNGGTTPSASNGGTTPSASNGGTTPNTEPVVPFADCKYETIVSNFCNQRCGGGRKTITYKILSEGTGGGASCTDTFKYLPKEESCNTFPCPSSATCKAQGQNSGTCRNFPGCVEDDDGRCCLDSERNEEGEESSMICRW